MIYLTILNTISILFLRIGRRLLSGFRGVIKLIFKRLFVMYKKTLFLTRKLYEQIHLLRMEVTL